MDESTQIFKTLTIDKTLKKFRGRWISAQTLEWTILFGMDNIVGGRMVDDIRFFAVFFTTTIFYLITTI